MKEQEWQYGEGAEYLSQDFMLSREEIEERRAERKARRKREREEMLKKRAELRARRKAILDSRPKKTWSNFLK